MTATKKLTDEQEIENRKREYDRVASEALAEGNIRWNYNDYVSPTEWIIRAVALAGDSINTMYELDGDMYVSDYRKIMELGGHLYQAAAHIKGESK